MQDSVHQWHNHLGTTIFIQQKSGETGLLVETLPSFRFEAVEAVASEVSFVIQVLQGPRNQHQSKNYCSKAVPNTFWRFVFKKVVFSFRTQIGNLKMHHPGILTITVFSGCLLVCCKATASTTIFTRSWILWHLPSWRPAQWRWLGCFLMFCYPKKGWVLSEERPCFVLMTVDFDCAHLFFCFSFFGFADVFYFSAHRPSVESFMTDLPLAGPEPWHVGEPTSAFWRRSNIPQIKEIMDFRIRSNYSRAFLRIPKFVETNPSEKSEKGNWISIQCWIWMCFSWFFSWIWMMREHSF